eukprot:1127623-Pyramimonas_sp.AAC.1
MRPLKKLRSGTYCGPISRRCRRLCQACRRAGARAQPLHNAAAAILEMAAIESPVWKARLPLICSPYPKM